MPLEEPPSPYDARERDDEDRTVTYTPVTTTLGHVHCSWEDAPRKYVVARSAALSLASEWEAGFVEGKGSAV